MLKSHLCPTINTWTSKGKSIEYHKINREISWCAILKASQMLMTHKWIAGLKVLILFKAVLDFMFLLKSICLHWRLLYVIYSRQR